MTLQNVDDIFPLTPMQHLMLMHSLRQRNSPSTLANQFRYRLRGVLSIERFTAAWQTAVNRHEALRTVFVWDDVPQPVQIVRSQVEVPLDFVDLQQCDETEQTARTEALQKADRERGFDLRQAPLMRLTIIALGPTEHILLWSRHHLILDLWSVELLFTEVLAHYTNSEQTLVPAGYFSDYIAWLQQQDPVQTEAFWREQLAGLSAPSLLVTDRAYRSVWSELGQPVFHRSLDTTTSAGIQAAVQRHGLTIGTFFQGVLALLAAVQLERLDVVIGLTVSGRPPAVDSVERTMGSFINNVPVRLAIDPKQAVLEWLHDIQNTQAARMPFEHVSPIDIQRWSGLPADTPLYDVLLLLQSPAAPSSVDSKLKIEPLDGPYDSAFPITLAVEGQEESINLTAVYDATVVAPDNVEALVDAVCQYAQHLATDLDAPLSSILPSNLDMGTANIHTLQNNNSGAKTIPDQPTNVTATPTDGLTNTSVTTLLGIWRETLGIPDLGLDDDFFAVGGTSIQAAIAFSEIEHRFGRALPLSTLFHASSVRKLMAALELPPEPFSSLVKIQQQGTRPAIVAVGGIGGNVVGMSDLARALGQNQPYFGLQSQGLDGVTDPAKTIEGIAAGFLDAIEPIGQRPIVLLGICFGANVALEMAHRLDQQGRPPILLIILDPTFDDGESNAVRPPPPNASGFFGFLVDRLYGYISTYRSLPREQRCQWWLEKRNNLLTKIRHRDVLHGNRFELTRRRVTAANYTAAQNYRPRAYAGQARVLLTTGRQLPLTEDPRRKWMAELVIAARAEQVPGNDTGTAIRNYAPVIANHIRHWIDEVSTAAPTVHQSDSSPTIEHSSQSLSASSS